jgi:hypothetical protein
VTGVKATANHQEFIVSTTTGFRVHKTENCELLLECKEIPGGCRFAQPYTKSSLFFLVGNSTSKPDQTLNNTEIGLWNDADKELLAKVSFDQVPILDLQVCQAWVIVTLATSTVHVFNLASESGCDDAFATVETRALHHKKGKVVACQHKADGLTLIVPGLQSKGTATLLTLDTQHHGIVEQRT